jgi:hypothetical protein
MQFFKNLITLISVRLLGGRAFLCSKPFSCITRLQEQHTTECCCVTFIWPPLNYSSPLSASANSVSAIHRNINSHWCGNSLLRLYHILSYIWSLPLESKHQTWNIKNNWTQNIQGLPLVSGIFQCADIDREVLSIGVHSPVYRVSVHLYTVGTFLSSRAYGTQDALEFCKH